MVNRFKLVVSGKTGFTTLWMATEESTCGYTPIIGWGDIRGLREFAEMLLDVYRHHLRDNERSKNTSDRILRQALYNEQFNEGGKNA